MRCKYQKCSLLLLSLTVICAVLLSPMRSMAQGEVLTLEACLDLAQKHNPTLQASAAIPRQVQAQERIADSLLLPHVDVEGGYTLQPEAQQVVMGEITTATQQRDYSHLSLSAKQLLYDFGRSKAQISAAAANSRSARLNYAALEQDIFLRTVVAYYRVLTAEHLLVAADDEAEQMADHLKVARALYAAGSVTRNDVLQAQVRLANSKEQQLVAKGELDNGRLQLNYLLGRSTTQCCQLSDKPLFEIDSLPSFTDVAARPQLLAQKEQVVAAQQRVLQARGEFWPQVYAHLGADYVDNSKVKEQTIYSATLGLRMNIYDGAANRSKLSAASHELSRQRLLLKDATEQAQRDYRSACNDAKVAAQRREVAQIAIDQAQENLRINRSRYQEQVGTATEVVDAQTLLTKTRSEFYRAQFDYQVAIARVCRAAGTL